MNVCIINGSGEYRRLFESMGMTVVTSVANADLVCFTGGADVSPDLYGDKKHPHTGNDAHRDSHETVAFKHAQYLNLPCVGICRGGQFLNVMSGGRMYQDVSGHCQSHEIVDTETGETIYVSSTHHQMMMPSDKAMIVATSRGITSHREWFDVQVFRRDVNTEGVEVVYYPHTRSLCFQPHPEFSGASFEGMKKYFYSLLERFKLLQATPVACGC
jgi:gamma-glutamyl-gamma-aminobutyrate hydrolase PuuD